MTNWKAGMKAVCIQTAWWKALHVPGLGPAYMETVTVTSVWYRDHPKGAELGQITMLRVSGWANSYSATGFRPLLGSEQEALSAIEEEVNELETVPA